MFSEEKCMRSSQSRLSFVIVIAIFYSDGVASRSSALIGKNVLNQESDIIKTAVALSVPATKYINSTPGSVKKTRLGDGFWSTRGNRFFDAHGQQVHEPCVDIMIHNKNMYKMLHLK